MTSSSVPPRPGDAPIILYREINGHLIGQRQADGYVNATALCKAAVPAKLFADYRRLSGTAEFMAELEGSMGIPIDQLVQSVMNGPNDSRGTWVHPDVAIHLAQWLSPKFAVQVSRWTRELLSVGRVELAPTTGDALLDQCEVIHRMSGVVVELRRRQVATEREVAEVRSLATAADEKASEALARADGSQGYCTVVGYYRRHDRRVSIAVAAQHGRPLAHQCRELGIEVCTVPDERHGRVNTYPVPILDDYFARVWAAEGN